MGAVYSARDRRLGRQVALKVLHRYLSSDEDLRSRLLREAKIASRINHPGVVRLLDTLENRDGSIVLVMEHVGGLTLKEALESAPFDAPRAVRIAEKMCEALAYIHSQGILFRDIKPSNVIIDEHDSPKFIDLGIAKGAGTEELTRTVGIVGTPAYMPPERIRGEPATDRSDIYQIGLVLFEMITGNNPFAGGGGGT